MLRLAAAQGQAPDRAQGGYNLEATAAGVEATLRVLLGERPLRLQLGRPSRLAMS